MTNNFKACFVSYNFEFDSSCKRILSFQQWFQVNSLFGTRFSKSELKSPRSKNDSHFTKNSPSCVDVATSTEKKLDNHLASVPVTPELYGFMEYRDETLSSVGAQDIDTSGYQVFEL